MGITPEQIAYLETVSRLRLTEEEKEEVERHLDQVLAYMEILEPVAAESKLPPDRDGPGPYTLREDRVTPSLPRQVLLANAREKTETYFVAPPTLE